VEAVVCALTISAYELNIAPPAFLRGYWQGYSGRAPVGVTPVCREQYDRGFAAGAADRRTIERLWARYTVEASR
jgi:hypothetical protein